MKSTIRLLIALMTFGTGLNAFSEETTGEKIESKVDEVKKDTKINVRAAKRKVRNATCTDARRAAGKCGVLKDAKDSVQDVGVEMSHEGKKIKNKVD